MANLNNNLIFKKHPSWVNVFSLWLKKYPNLNIEKLETTFMLFLTYKKAIHKDVNINYAMTLIHDSNDSPLDIIDIFSNEIDNAIDNQKKQKFINSVKTRKYKHLFSCEVDAEIRSILDNISIATLKKQLFNTISRIDSSDDLLNLLIEFKEKNINWNKTYYLNKIKKEQLNVHIHKEQNNYVVVEVKDYEACKSLGSTSWCVSYDSLEFEDYTKYKTKQFIAFNFNLPIEHNESLIGFTLKLSGEIQRAHLKNNKEDSVTANNLFTFSQHDCVYLENVLEKYSKKDRLKIICANNLVLLLVKHLKDTKDLNLECDSFTIFNILSWFDSLECFCTLIKDPRINIAEENNQIFRLCCANDNIDFAKILLKNSAVDPSALNDEAFRIACYYQYKDLVKILLDDSRVNPSSQNNQAIVLATIHGCKYIITMLLNDTRVDPTDNNYAALSYALAYRSCHRYDIYSMLLEDYRVNSANCNFLCVSKLDKDFLKQFKDPFELFNIKNN